jgi:hypothetical protein
MCYFLGDSVEKTYRCTDPIGELRFAAQAVSSTISTLGAPTPRALTATRWEHYQIFYQYHLAVE